MQMNKTQNQLNLLGKILTNINLDKKSQNLQDYEFKVYSQWGEDGIIQYLINKIPIKNNVFIEIGVENYEEANTRFLLENNNWAGLIIDCSRENIDYIKNSDLYWKYSLTAVAEFVTKNNVNDLIKKSGVNGDIGILSIDVDGNDYWIFEALNCIDPRIIIIEYNSVFGSDLKVSIPYEESFARTKNHYSGLYFGASIAALTDLADKKGYSLVGSNSAGCNLFFVKKEYAGDLKVLSPKRAYVKSKFRQSRDENGDLTYLSHETGIKLIEDMDIFDFKTGEIDKLQKLLNRG